MAMVKGTKRWSLFHADDVPFLSPDYSRGTLDPAFPHIHAMDDAHAKADNAAAPAGAEDADAHAESNSLYCPCDEYPFLPFARWGCTS